MASSSALLELGLLGALATAAGCTKADPSSGDCSAREPAFLAACVQSSSTQVDEANGHVFSASLQLEGTVVEQGSGDAPEGCFASRQTAVPHESIPRGATEPRRWLRVESADGKQAVVGLQLPDLALDVANGESVSIDFFSDPAEGFAPALGGLLLRDAAGELLAWVGFGGSAGDFVPPEGLSISTGPVACVATSECVTEWTLNDMTVRHEGQNAVVPYGGAASLGSYTFVHGDLQIQTGDSVCSDAYVARAAAAAWRRPPTPPTGY